MGVEDELRRVLRDENLDVPVRTGAEWSVMAGARRRRQRHNAVAALGGVLAATMLAGSGVALVNYRSTEPTQVPPASSVVPSTSHNGTSTEPDGSSPVPHESRTGWSTDRRDPGQWADPPVSSSESEEEPTILDGTVPPATSSSPPSSSSASPTTEEPSTTTSAPGG